MTPVVSAWLFLFLPGYQHVTFPLNAPLSLPQDMFTFSFPLLFSGIHKLAYFCMCLSHFLSIHPHIPKACLTKLQRKKGRIFSCGIFLLYFPSSIFCWILPTFLRIHVLSHILSFDCNKKKVTKKLKLKYKNSETK